MRTGDQRRRAGSAVGVVVVVVAMLAGAARAQVVPLTNGGFEQPRLPGVWADLRGETAGLVPGWFCVSDGVGTPSRLIHGPANNPFGWPYLMVTAGDRVAAEVPLEAGREYKLTLVGQDRHWAPARVRAGGCEVVLNPEGGVPSEAAGWTRYRWVFVPTESGPRLPLEFSVDAAAGEGVGAGIDEVRLESLWLDSPPTSRSFCPGEALEASVLAGGSPLEYQWERTVWDPVEGSRWEAMVDGPVLDEDGVVRFVVWGSRTAAVRFEGPFREAYAGVGVRCRLSNEIAGLDTWPVTLRHGRPYPGDFNFDGFIDWADYDAFFAEFEPQSPGADVNGDGFVDALDLERFLRSFESGC